MTSTPRQRFSVRAGLSEAVDDGPYEGLPPHLESPLQAWVNEELSDPFGHTDDEAGRSICLRLRIAASGDYLRVLSEVQGAELLDVVDALLAYRVEKRDTNPTQLAALDRVLDEGGSAYRISWCLDGLEERVTRTVRDALRHTVDEAAATGTAGSAADHLATAWQSAYGRHPDSVRAYSEAIKAVESAAHAIIQPNHARATLGTMLGEIGNARANFTSAIPAPANRDAIAPVEAMMRTLWDGQTSRHGKQTGTVPETLDAARAGVHLAATLVQWFTSGFIVRNP